MSLVKRIWLLWLLTIVVAIVATVFIVKCLSDPPTFPQLSEQPSKNIYWHTPASLNQESEPACVGYSLEAWLLSEPRPNSNIIPAHQIWKEAQALGPYSKTDQDGASLLAGAIDLYNHSYIKGYWTSSDAKVLRSFIQVAPIVIDSDWYYGMSSLNSDGYSVPLGNKIGRHAYECSGYITSGDREDSFLCQNTWGTVWGDHGQFFIHYTDMVIIMKHGYAVLMLKS